MGVEPFSCSMYMYNVNTFFCSGQYINCMVAAGHVSENALLLHFSGLNFIKERKEGCVLFI